MPRPQAEEGYSQSNERIYRARIDDELMQKHDRRADLRIGVGKSIVFGATDGVEYAMGLDADGLLVLTNYATGEVGEFVIDWTQAQGLEAQLLALETAFEAADGAISSAYIAADAVVAADAAGARAALYTTISAEWAAGDSAVESAANSYTDAEIATEASARASADTAIASTVTSLTATVGTNTSGIAANAAAIATESAARASADSAISSTVTSLTATVGTNTSNIATNAAAITTEATARASGDSANASSISTLRASVQGRAGSVIPDAAMQDADFWNLASGASFNVPGGGSRFARRLAFNSGSYSQFSEEFAVTPGATYRIRCRVSATGSGHAFHAFIHVPNYAFLSLYTEAAVDIGTSAGSFESGDTGYKEFVFTNPTGVTSNANRNWQIGFAGTVASGLQVFVELDIIELGQYGEVKILQDAFVDSVTGQVRASLQLIVDANGRVASGILSSDGTSSEVAFNADAFKIYNGSTEVPVFSVSGGTIYLNGPVVSTESVALGGRATAGFYAGLSGVGKLTGDMTCTVYNAAGIVTYLWTSNDPAVSFTAPNSATTKAQRDVSPGTTHKAICRCLVQDGTDVREIPAVATWTGL